MFEKKESIRETTEAPEMSGNGVTREVAEADFNRILKAARVKWELFRQFSGTRDADNDKTFIIEEIMSGGITVNDDGFPTVHTEKQGAEKIKIFRRPIRADKLMIDRCKDGHNVKAQDAVLGEFLKVSPSILESLDEVDFKKIEVLWFLFLGY